MPFYDSHTHTRLCKHAVGVPMDYAAAAATAGLTGFIVTDHNPPFEHPYGLPYRMDPNQFDEYLELVEMARTAWAGRVDVRLGIECDFVPGLETDIEASVCRAPYDYVLGSLHCNMRDHLDRFFNGDVRAYTTLYYEQMGQAAESGFYDALAHPDVPKFMWPELWDFERIRPDVCRFLNRVAASGMALELNTSGVLKAYPEMNPGREMLVLMNERGIPVVVGSDAHDPARTGDGFVAALQLLQQAGYEKASYFLNRQRVDENICTVLRELTRPNKARRS